MDITFALSLFCFSLSSFQARALDHLHGLHHHHDLLHLLHHLECACIVIHYHKAIFISTNASVLCWPKQIHMQQLKSFTSAHYALLRMGVSNLFAGLTRATKVILLKHKIGRASCRERVFGRV